MIRCPNNKRVVSFLRLYLQRCDQHNNNCSNQSNYKGRCKVFSGVFVPNLILFLQ